MKITIPREKTDLIQGLRLAALSILAAGFLVAATASAEDGLPALSSSGIPKPSGAVGGLKVLEWAGLKSAVSYTFDDALPSQASNYSRLRATGIKMTFFLVANNGYNATWKQIAEDGNELGNHTAHHCHADGSGCGTEWAGSIEAEFNLCSQNIEQSYDVPHVWTAASPFGDTGFDNIAKDIFFLNRGVRGGQVAPKDETDPYNLPIYAAKTGDTANTFNAQIDLARSAGTWQIFLFHSLGGDNGYAPIDPEDLLASIDHAKSLGDVWIDTMVNVGAYWAGQKAVAAATAIKSGNSTVLTWTLPANFPPGKHVRVTVTGGTLKQNGVALPWNDAGYYEVALDPGSLTISR